jgi:hypothetical protein
VASLAVGFPPPPVIVTLAAAVFVTTMVSGIDYIITYSRRAAEVARARRA